MPPELEQAPEHAISTEGAEAPRADAQPPESSPGKDVQPPESSPGTGAPSDSPPEKGAQPDQPTAFDVAKVAMAKLREKAEKVAGSPPAKPAPESKDKPTEKADDGKGKPAPEKAEPEVPTEFAKHPAWQRIQSERRAAVEEVATIKAQLEATRPMAEHFEKLTGFLKASNIETEGFQLGMQALQAFASESPVRGIELTLDVLENAAMTDPVRAWEMLRPMVEKIRMAAGDELPEDLAGKVNSGVLAEAEAREIARLRAKDTTREAMARAQRERDERRQVEAEEARVAQAREAVVDAIAEWERTWRTNNPDADKLTPFVTPAILEKLTRYKGELTKEQVRKIAADTAAEVKERLKSMLPERRPVIPMPGGRPANVQGEPANAFDAAKAAYEGIRTGAVSLPT